MKECVNITLTYIYSTTQQYGTIHIFLQLIGFTVNDDCHFNGNGG